MGIFLATGVQTWTACVKAKGSASESRKGDLFPWEKLWNLGNLADQD
jgi:hypothetical protein